MDEKSGKFCDATFWNIEWTEFELSSWKFLPVCDMELLGVKEFGTVFEIRKNKKCSGAAIFLATMG